MAVKQKSLAQFLKQTREKADLSQRQVADVLGYQSAQFISNWERGVSSPPIKTLKKLGDLYRIKAETLYQVMVQDTLRRIEGDLHREFYGPKAAARRRA
jgi:transcriptional regulator with XRE-family HTH domain